MMRRPARLGPRHAAAFRDRSVAESYRNRPPYPVETVAILAGLVPSRCRRVLDVGCGTGFVARPLAAAVDAVDGLDPSSAMLGQARRLPGGDRPNLRWIQGTAEEGEIQPPYGLIVAAGSFHWFQWDVVLPRFADALVPEGPLAIVQQHRRGGPDLRELIPRYSTNQDFAIDDDYDWQAELVRRGLMTPLGHRETAWTPFRQTFDQYVDGIHTTSGSSRERMGPEAVAEFDRELRAILARTYPSGRIETELRAVVAWFRPGRGERPEPRLTA